jgi:protoheme IX farnesyltransferase
VNSEAAIAGVRVASRGGRLAAYYELTKPRVLTMVLITTLAGYYMGSGGADLDLALALKILLGTGLAAGGTLALNQFFERATDARMERTCNRPLPLGRLRPVEALVFGLIASTAGVAGLWLTINPLTAAITATITVLYLGAYTPLKRYTWMCQVIGAVPGALPPVIGWAAARNDITAEPLVMFGIMFLWQLPHSLSIARLYQADYLRAGIHPLPKDRAWGNPANVLMLAATVVLVAFGTLPTLMGFAGRLYLAVAVVFGLVMLYHGIRLVRGETTSAAARRVLMVSLVYLPVVLLAMVLDKA